MQKYDESTKYIITNDSGKSNYAKSFNIILLAKNIQYIESI